MKRVKFYFTSNNKLENEDLIPTPSKMMIPTWFKDSEDFIDGENLTMNILDKEKRHAATKHCFPFFDTLSSGYFILLWQDIEIVRNDSTIVEFRKVKKDSNGLWVEDFSQETGISERLGDLGHTMPRPAGYSYNHMVWKQPWSYKLPKGWSMLMTHPLNRWDLPFITASGIVDGDKFNGPGNVPFFIKEGWTGVLEKGTPIIHLIPIKRKSWMANYSSNMPKKDQKIMNSLREPPGMGYYRKYLWSKKEYDFKKRSEDK